MNIEKATYSYKKVHECCDMVKALSISCSRKCEHFAIACELEKVANRCYEATGDMNFEPKYTAVEDYRVAAYYHKRYTKKQLDDKARAALRHLQNELTGILALMATGEVNVED